MAGYSPFDALSATNSAAKTKRSAEAENTSAYTALLDDVRREVAENHSDTLLRLIESDDQATTLRTIIARLVALKPLGNENIEDTVDRIYDDMAGLGILSQYVRDSEIEEININAFNRIEIQYADRTEYLKEGFASPQTAVDVITKMVRMGGRLLDATQPDIDSHIGGGIRISAAIPPIVPEEYGVVASIRKQNKSSITEEELLANGTATKEMLDFVSLCFGRGISVGIVGSTGTGKTTDQSYLINRYIQTTTKINSRITIIEDTRELIVDDWVEDKNQPSRVNYMLTKPEPNPISMRRLLEKSLRFHPDVIVPTEVRGEAAFEAANAGITGHTILTGFHADNSEDAYDRLLAMMAQSGCGLSEEILLSMAIKAWPIIVSKRQLDDRRRIWCEVYEAEAREGTTVRGRILWEWELTGEEVNEKGEIVRVHGKHNLVNRPSEKLIKKLINKGAKREELERIFPTQKAPAPKKRERKVKPKGLSVVDKGGATLEKGVSTLEKGGALCG